MCATVINVERDSRLTGQLGVGRMSVMWAGNDGRAFFLASYRDLLRCETERVIV